MNFSNDYEFGIAGLLEKLRAHAGPLATVAVAHALLFYFISTGLLTRMVDAATPKAVVVSFVAEPTKAPPPAPPQTVAVAVLQPPVLPQVPIPVIQVAPQPDSITVVQAAAPAEKAPAPVAVALASPVPAPPAAAPRTITSGVEYIQPPQPVYPPMSKRMGEQGKVILRVLINESGKPGQVLVQTSSGFMRLDEAGRQAALRALYKPHLQDGRAVAVYVIVPVNFQLAS